ncbi:MAG TPA: hypothetical protein VEQ63_09500 [Bryobacteraceae bacterium]|nr:hypothetical protein [Bryobacteraceae bacterium]
MQLSRSVAALCLVVLLAAVPLSGQRKKKKYEESGGLPPVLEESKRKKEKPVVTEALELPKDPPQTIVAEAQRLAFFVSPLSSKGLLSQQTRDALKAVFAGARGASIVNIRAFVAGTGDLRRVQTIVSETFSDRRLGLPTFSVVQAGGLALEGAQVVLEATMVERKASAPYGLGFLGGTRVPVSESVNVIQRAVADVRAKAGDVRKITCFVESIELAGDLRTQMTQSFPSASFNFVQSLRDSAGDRASCEGVIALGEGASNGPGIATVGPGRILLTGTQLAFGGEEADLRLAFDRLGKALESGGGDLKNIVYGRASALDRNALNKVDQLWRAYCPAKPASTSTVFESLPSLDATAGIEVVVRVE